VRVHRGDGRFWLDSDQAGDHAVEVRLRPPGSCSVEGATEVPSTEPGWRVFEEPEQLPPTLRSVRTYVSDGACVTYRFEFDDAVTASAAVALDASLGFQPRADLVGEVDRRSGGLVLCGVGAPPCAGGSG